jgi:hypothetical protein
VRYVAPHLRRSTAVTVPARHTGCSPTRVEPRSSPRSSTLQSSRTPVARRRRNRRHTSSPPRHDSRWWPSLRASKSSRHVPLTAHHTQRQTLRHHADIRRVRPDRRNPLGDTLRISSRQLVNGRRKLCGKMRRKGRTRRRNSHSFARNVTCGMCRRHPMRWFSESAVSNGTRGRTSPGAAGLSRLSRLG